MNKKNILPQSIVFSGDYKCIIDGQHFSIAVASSLFDGSNAYYRIANNDKLGINNFESLIKLTQHDISAFKQFSDYEIIYDNNGNILYLRFETLKNAQNYLIVVMRWLMQRSKYIQVIGETSVFLARIKYFGLTVAPLGDKLILCPDYSSFEKPTYDYEDTTNIIDDDSILTINVRKRKSLKLDFKE